MRIIMIIYAVYVCLAIVLITGCSNSTSASKKEISGLSKKNKSIGIYDSRCIAIAYYNSEVHRAYVQEARQEHKVAKAAGDIATAKVVEDRMVKSQELAHYQSFGTASVDNLLDKVADSVNHLKVEKNLDLLVSKWNYAGDLNKCIDITTDLVKLYNPGPKAQKWIEQTKDIKPISQDELEKMDDSCFQ